MRGVTKKWNGDRGDRDGEQDELRDVERPQQRLEERQAAGETEPVAPQPGAGAAGGSAGSLP